ncbi:MAG: TonB family protein [Verrucomicrobiota bacterium]|jgi:protein TonB
MNAINANAGAGGYQLKSELARVCLPAPHAHDQRNLAWTNSICLLFLFIGLVGFRPKPPPPIPVKPLEEAQPVIIEPPPPPPVSRVELSQDINPPEKPDTAQPKVLVTLPSPAILFSSPTLNGTLVPLKQYQVPAETNSVPQTPPPRQPAQPGQVTSTGVGGDRPEPTYPKMAEELGQQGSVVLLLTADEAGLIISAEVKESSGSSILDRAAADFIKRHWTVPPGARGRLFQARIDYKLH